MNLVHWTNQNSDGWPYWRKPAAASARLQDLIHAASLAERRGFAPQVSTASVLSAYTPLKAFRTRQGKADFPIIPPR